MVFTSRFHCMGGIALSATVPYMNAWLFNLLQSLLVIFVGVEFCLEGSAVRYQ